MRLDGQAATGAAQRVIGGFLVDAAGWLLLVIAVTAGSRRVLMRAADRGVHADVPVDTPAGIGVGLQPGQDPRPGPVALPPAEQAVDRLPRRVLLGHVTPRSTDSDPPPNPIYELPFRPFRRTTCTQRGRQERGQSSPVRGGQVVPPRHR
jgi:hypothetical protein